MAVRAAAQLTVQRSSRMIAELTNQRSRHLRRHIVCYHILVKLVKELSSFRCGGVLVEFVDCRLEGFERAKPISSLPCSEDKEPQGFAAANVRAVLGASSNDLVNDYLGPARGDWKVDRLGDLEVQAAFKPCILDRELDPNHIWPRAVNNPKWAMPQRAHLGTSRHVRKADHYAVTRHVDWCGGTVTVSVALLLPLEVL